jgi:hypothetical protein
MRASSRVDCLQGPRSALSPWSDLAPKSRRGLEPETLERVRPSAREPAFIFRTRSPTAIYFFRAVAADRTDRASKDGALRRRSRQPCESTGETASCRSSAARARMNGAVGASVRPAPPAFQCTGGQTISAVQPALPPTVKRKPCKLTIAATRLRPNPRPSVRRLLSER